MAFPKSGTVSHLLSWSYYDEILKVLSLNQYN